MAYKSFIIFLYFISATIFSNIASQQVQENHNTGLACEQDDPLIIFSTLDGALIGVGQRSGEIRWKQDDEPLVKVPINCSKSAMPIFLPDPKDGSLYLFGTDSEALKKLPFTIPQLVANSPCRSSDGILYTGRKIDTWFTVDPRTGRREQVLGFDNVANTCPVEIQDVIFIGRTEYNIIMVDSKQKDRQWNVTFYDYSAAKMENNEDENYDLVHFTTSSTGRVVTLDKRLGTILWQLNLESPVVATYTVTKDGLLTLPFTSVAEGTLDNLLEHFVTKPNYIQLFPTLYIGQHEYGFYALPSLIDSATATISSNAGYLLLEGPLTVAQIHKNDNRIPLPGDHIVVGNINIANDEYQSITSESNIITLGYYEIPAEYNSEHQPLQITGSSEVSLSETSSLNLTTHLPIILSNNTPIADDGMQEGNWHKILAESYRASKKWLNQQENKGLKLVLIILVGCIVAMFWYFNAQFKEFQQLSQGSRENSRTNSNTKRSNIVIPEDMGEGLVRVGKITFNTSEVLGKGCEGTFVYKGEFDGRSVAVKRLLPDCFTLADREVTLLRESDEHPNVVRYFCTEHDRMFRYIALELAEATLQDYVVGEYDREKISEKDILRQATSGLEHLHLLDIVHRDIKPHNVLLSVPGPRGEVRAMISDFGLCKKLQVGRVSFSRRSGVTGTDGWIAPEMLNGERTTCAVDIFSLGCVFYYVLSDGKHPFGGESDLTALHGISKSDKELALNLIKAMISEDPSERPPAAVVYNHPLFWNPTQILNFFQDVSDRVEKEQFDSPALLALEHGNQRVVKGDWRMHIDNEVAADLRKYRTYDGGNVRDLLRALRNKKHHYRELMPAAQKSLGEIPEKFTEYWLSRFPCLLCHIWIQMQKFRNEPTLKRYYHVQYNFVHFNEIEEYETQEKEVISLSQENEVICSSPQKVRKGTIDWNANHRGRHRGNRRKQEKKKVIEPSTLVLPSS
ncbi:PREDICTED: serine/threonine-protein kinase/endoribonuclease IRE1 isoform X2 [Polistes dominula]|uniref:non-specific serine/threonine protein kinase n=1 Tax=Polistes dominula TaxID=743375 RepID=A0ABM1IZJ8_POLDO|nr:PREDICTED: serine/threonine-protein kinase/endoribonuclease IRE1 isoform X2 [Polistes dominula]